MSELSIQLLAVKEECVSIRSLLTDSILKAGHFRYSS